MYIKSELHYYKQSYSMDQFYTKPDIAKQCYQILNEELDIRNYDILMEPSAGTGSFFNLLPQDKRIGIDLEPKCDGVGEGNFLDFEANRELTYLIVGNPPFGKVCSLAVKFFNKAALFANAIAFIVPRTFKRASIWNKLDKHFHLVKNFDLSLKPCCFEPSMSAKCCFQVWVKKECVRSRIIYNKTHKDFSFLKLGPLDKNKQPTPPTGADFVVKAYGGNCGEIVKDGLDTLRPKSWHWIKSNIAIDTLVSRIGQLDFSMSKDTVRQDSIGQQELIFLYENCFGA